MATWSATRASSLFAVPGALLAVSCALAAAACSGRVVTPPGSSSAGAGGEGAATAVTASTTTSQGANGGGGAGTFTCPEGFPPAGTPCQVPPAVTCSYGDCCPSIAECIEGVWVTEIGICPPSCPADPPAAGASCSYACAGDVSCAYACGEDLPLFASCGADGVWHTTPDLCPGAVACGGVQCYAGNVCVTWQGFGPPPHCVPDPCAPGALDCSCAQTICGDYPCVEASAGHVVCLCPNCE